MSAVDTVFSRKPDERVRRFGSPPIPSNFTRENVFVFLAGVIVYASLAAYLQARGIFFLDAVSRSASAFYVLFSRDPHLAAIGFVWNPLPTFIQLPVVFSLNLFHLDPTLAGRLVSVLAATITLGILNTFFRSAGITPIARWLLLATYALNPMILLYAANGMSESIFILLIVLLIVTFVRWARTGSGSGFTLMAFTAMFALQTRYEALPLVVGLAFCIMPVMAPLARWLGVGPTIRRVEAHLIAFMFATSYSFGLWMYFNWQIMGNPLFFLQSIYGNIAQVSNVAPGAAVDPAVGSILGSLAYSFGQTLWVAPALAILVPMAVVLVVLRRSVVLFCVLLLFLTIPLFQAYEIYVGDSFKWLRFFMYGIPFAYLLLALVTAVLPRWFAGQRPRLAWGLLLGGLAVANLGTFVAMQQPDTAGEEWEIVGALLDPARPVPPTFSRTAEFEIARYLQSLPEGETVIFDTVVGNWIPLADPGPTTYTVTSDRDFESILSSPGGLVTHLLIPDPAGGGALDRLNIEFPGLWEGPVPDWLRLEREFPVEPEIWTVTRVRGSALTSRYRYLETTTGEVVTGSLQMLPLSAQADPIGSVIPVGRYEPRRWRLYRIVAPRPGTVNAGAGGDVVQIPPAP